MSFFHEINNNQSRGEQSVVPGCWAFMLAFSSLSQSSFSLSCCFSILHHLSSSAFFPASAFRALASAFQMSASTSLTFNSSAAILFSSGSLQEKGTTAQDSSGQAFDDFCRGLTTFACGLR